MRVSLRLLATMAGVGLSAQLACHTSIDDRPLVALATTPQSELRFSSVRVRWATASSAERAAMRAEIEALQASLEAQQDALEPVARAYLAIAWIDGGVPDAAEAVARPLYEGPPGVTHDLGVLVRGVAQRRQGHAAAAVETLRPIVGKLIDPFARPLLYEEMTEALVDEGRYDEAIGFAQAWLRAADVRERKTLHAAIARVVSRIPLDAVHRAIDAQRTTQGSAGYSPELILILDARLDSMDEATLGDSGVALLSDPGPFDAESLALPADAPIAPTLPLPIRFDPRAIALLVPSSLMGFGAVSTATIRGATAVLSPTSIGARGQDADSSVSAPLAASHRLGVFDTGGTPLGLDRALDAAERDGAALVIGGVTEAEANALAFLSQARHLPAVLLRAPTAPPKLAANEPRTYVVLGLSVAEEIAATLAAAPPPSASRAVVDGFPEPGDPPTPSDPLRTRCDVKAKSAEGTDFPIDDWRARKVATIVVLGDAFCARHLARELAAAKPPYHPRLVLSLSSLELLHESLPFAREAVAAGILPADDAAPAALQALWREQLGPVGFWNALGHDAARIALGATPGDLSPTTDPDDVRKARAATRGRMLAANELALWSTELDAVPAGGVLTRKTFARSVGAGGAWSPAWLADPGPTLYK